MSLTNICLCALIKYHKMRRNDMPIKVCVYGRGYGGGGNPIGMTQGKLWISIVKI